MCYEYVCPKTKLKKKGIKEVQVLFRNGDYFQLSGREIVDIDVRFYDTLVAGEDGFCRVAESGFVKCRIKVNKPRYDNSFLCDRKEYSKNRKTYLERRCIDDGGVYCFRFFNGLRWSHLIYGDVVAYMDSDDLVFSFQENRIYGSADKNYHRVMAPDLTKRNVRSLTLDFENCDGIEIFQEEIIDMKFNIERRLAGNASCFCRVIKDGFIRLKFDEKYIGRRADVYCGSKKNTIKNCEKRLCGKGVDEIDICNLYVKFQPAGIFIVRKEGLGIRDIRPQEIQNLADEDEYHTIPAYVSGYAKKEKEGSILIVFGKELKNS